MAVRGRGRARTLLAAAACVVLSAASLPAVKQDANRCAEAVQGEIAWDYEGSTRWAEANVDRLCAWEEDSTEPARCFERVMHGGVDWGGGTRWQWKNALELCRGTRDAEATVSCFETRVGSGLAWKEAIESCQWDLPSEPGEEEDGGGAGSAASLLDRPAVAEAVLPLASGDPSGMGHRGPGPTWTAAGVGDFSIGPVAEARYCVSDVVSAFEALEFGRRRGKNFYTLGVGAADTRGVHGHMQGVARLPGEWLVQSHSGGVFLSHFSGHDGVGHRVWAGGVDRGAAVLPDLPEVERGHVGGLHAYHEIVVVPSDSRVEIFRHQGERLERLTVLDVTEWQGGAHFASILPLEGGDWLLAVGHDSRDRRGPHRVHFYVVPRLDTGQSELRYLGRWGRGRTRDRTRDDFQSASLLAGCDGRVFVTGTGVRVVQSNEHAKLYRLLSFTRADGGRPSVEVEKLEERSPGSERNDCSLNAAATFFPTAERALAMYCSEKEIRDGRITTREYRDEGS